MSSDRENELGPRIYEVLNLRARTIRLFDEAGFPDLALALDEYLHLLLRLSGGEYNQVQDRLHNLGRGDSR